jgi:hypothetical protein
MAARDTRRQGAHVRTLASQERARGTRTRRPEARSIWAGPGESQACQPRGGGRRERRRSRTAGSYPAARGFRPHRRRHPSAARVPCHRCRTFPGPTERFRHASGTFTASAVRDPGPRPDPVHPRRTGLGAVPTARPFVTSCGVPTSCRKPGTVPLPRGEPQDASSTCTRRFPRAPRQPRSRRPARRNGRTERP